jgi:hypothetical protein
MTIDIAADVSPQRARVGERLHEFICNKLRVDTHDVLVTVHADGTVTMQLAADITRADEPRVRTLSLPRGRCGVVGSYSVSIDFHHDYVAEVDDASIRRDALAILERVLAEMSPSNSRSQSPRRP